MTFKIAYGLPLEEMLRWGLFVSQPRSIRETDQPFPEPGDWGIGWTLPSSSVPLGVM